MVSAGGMGDNRLKPLVLPEDERRTLANRVRRRSTAQGLAPRARIVLACADGGSNTAVAARPGVSFKTVSGWRARFLRDLLDELTDDPRPGVPRTITDAQAEQVVVRTDLENLARRHDPDLDLEAMLDHLAGVGVFGDERLRRIRAG